MNGAAMISGKFCDRPRARTPAQMRAETESSRAPAPYAAGWDFSFAPPKRTGALKSKPMRSLGAYGRRGLFVITARNGSDSEDCWLVSQAAALLVPQLPWQPLDLFAQTNHDPHSFMIFFQQISRKPMPNTSTNSTDDRSSL